MAAKIKDRTLSRDIVATQVPSGDKHTLYAGTQVFIHQILGGSYTIQSDTGLYKVDGKDADALGEEAVDHSIEAATMADGSPDPEAVWEQLKKVYDPEIPVNIVDLGLVYSMDISKGENGYIVDMAMTLTAPGCGMGDAIAEDARGKVLLVPGISEVNVQLTWEPPWNQSMISEEGKMILGLV